MKNYYILIALAALIILGCKKVENLDDKNIKPSDTTNIIGSIESAKMISMNSMLFNENFAGAGYGYSVIKSDSNNLLICLNEAVNINSILYLINIKNKKILDRLDIGTYSNLGYFPYLQIIPTADKEFLILTQEYKTYLCKIFKGSIVNNKILMGKGIVAHKNAECPSFSIFNNEILFGYWDVNKDLFTHKGAISKCSIKNNELVVAQTDTFTNYLSGYLNILPLADNYFILGNGGYENKKYQTNFMLGKYNSSNGFTFYENHHLCENKYASKDQFDIKAIDGKRFIISYIDNEKAKLFINTYTLVDNKIINDDSYSINTNNLYNSYYVSMTEVKNNELYIAYTIGYHNYETGCIRHLQLKNNIITSSPPWIFSNNTHWFKLELENDLGIIVYRDGTTNGSFVGTFNKAQFYYK